MKTHTHTGMTCLTTCIYGPKQGQLYQGVNTNLHGIHIHVDVHTVSTCPPFRHYAYTCACNWHYLNKWQPIKSQYMYIYTDTPHIMCLSNPLLAFGMHYNIRLAPCVAAST